MPTKGPPQAHQALCEHALGTEERGGGEVHVRLEVQVQAQRCMSAL